MNGVPHLLGSGRELGGVEVARVVLVPALESLAQPHSSKLLRGVAHAPSEEVVGGERLAAARGSVEPLADLLRRAREPHGSGLHREEGLKVHLHRAAERLDEARRILPRLQDKFAPLEESVCSAWRPKSHRGVSTSWHNLIKVRQLIMKDPP